MRMHERVNDGNSKKVEHPLWRAAPRDAAGLGVVIITTAINWCRVVKL